MKSKRSGGLRGRMKRLTLDVGGDALANSYNVDDKNFEKTLLSDGKKERVSYVCVALI